MTVIKSLVAKDRSEAVLARSEGVNPKIIGHITIRQFFSEIALEDEDLISETTSKRKNWEENPKEYNALKSKKIGGLPAILPGKWEKRNRENIIEYLPLIILDFDGYEDEHMTNLDLIELKKNEYVYATFTSPSGKGLRVLIWTNSTFETHKKVYESLANYFGKIINIPYGKPKDGGCHIDKKTSSPASMFYYVPVDKQHEFYLNENSKTYIYSPPEKMSEISISSGGDTDFELRKTKFLISQIEQKGFDMTFDYDDWLSIGCAFRSEFGEVGREFFHAVSKFFPNYSEVETNKKYDSFSLTGSKRIGTFYGICKKHGFSYKGLFKDEKKATRRRVPALLSSKRFEFKILETPDFPSEELPDKKDDLTIEKEHCNYIWRGTRISNFIIKPYYLLKSQGDSKRIFEIVNEFGDSEILCLPQETLAHPTKLSIAVEGRGNFIPDWNKKQFNKIKEVNYSREKRAVEIKTLGYQSAHDFYAFSNGIFNGKQFKKVNDFGIIEINEEYFYIPAYSRIYRDTPELFKNEQNFKCQFGELNFSKWAKLFCEVYSENDNGKIGISYMLASLFRDIIYQTLDFFPVLFLFGPPQTGKTSFFNSCQYLFGKPQPIISLGGASTSKGSLRMLAQLKNGLVVFDEFKNQIKPAKIEILKGIYDGFGYVSAKKTHTNETRNTSVSSATIVAGQQLPVKENALFSRVFILRFLNKNRKNTEKYDELKRQQKKGLGKVTLEILSHRELVKKEFGASHEAIMSEFKRDPELNKFEDRGLSLSAALLAPIYILERHLSLPFSYQELKSIITSQLGDRNKILEKTNEVNRFFQFVDLGISDGVIRPLSYLIDKKEDVIYLHVESLYSAYFKHYNERKTDVLDIQSLKSYLYSEPSFILPKTGRKAHLKKTKSGGKKRRVLAFDLKKLSFNFQD